VVTWGGLCGSRAFWVLVILLKEAIRSAVVGVVLRGFFGDWGCFVFEKARESKKQHK